MDFDSLWTNKIKQKLWRVLQKSTFDVVRYRMCLKIDFGAILDAGWEQFWNPIGLQERLRKQVL